MIRRELKWKKKGIKQETDVKIVHIFIYDNMEPIHSFLPGETRVLTYQYPNPAKPVNKLAKNGGRIKMSGNLEYVASSNNNAN